VRDVKRGTGPVVRPYDQVMIDFIEAYWETGRKFSVGWKDGPAPTVELPLEPIEQMRGFVQGVDGMRVGGRRRIVVPPHLSGIETQHPDFRSHIYWDVVLRQIVARGRRPTDEERGFAPNRWREPRGIAPHPDAQVDRVIVREIARGRGPGLFANATVWVDFIEANYRTGRTLYRAWGDDPQPTETLEVAAMMRGFQKGMHGMRAGGRRQIVVPPHLSDVDDPDRRGPTYRQPVYFDVVLRHLDNPVIVP
jgi:peptidylprolyl isomerase